MITVEQVPIASYEALAPGERFLMWSQTLSWERLLHVYPEAVGRRVVWHPMTDQYPPIAVEGDLEVTGEAPMAPESSEILEWRKRELMRFQSLEYRYTPWEDQTFWHTDSAIRVRRHHYAHIANNNNKMLAYTPNDDYGIADRQIRLRPGKYLMKHMPWLRPGEIESAVSAWKGAEQFKLQIATEPMECEYVYENGPRSCMSGDSDFDGLPHHPAYVYGAGELGVAYFVLPDCDRDEYRPIGARTIVHLEKKLYSDSMYGDYKTLTYLLKSAGWEQGGLSAFRGAKLLRVSVENWHDNFLMPYLDIGEEVTDFDTYFRIGDNFTGGRTVYGAQSTSGMTYPLKSCYECSNTLHGSQIYYACGEDYCEDCYNRNFTYCHFCDEVYSNDDTQWYDTLDSSACESCADTLLFECDFCELTYSNSQMDTEMENVCENCAEDLIEEEEEEPIVIEPVLETYTPNLFTEGDESV